VLFYSGDDSTAKTEVGALIDRLGFAGIDLAHSRWVASSHNFLADHCLTRTLLGLASWTFCHFRSWPFSSMLRGCADFRTYG
jgi:predicted dinucleotide-binding enzyme